MNKTCLGAKAAERKAYACTAADLWRRGKKDIPPELVSNTHLIYSSPATLAFNSPGAEGFGVKRAGLALPDSVMLIVSPGCCGRNTSAISTMPGYENRFFYLIMDETDLVTGRHLKRIPAAVDSLVKSLPKKPSVVMICITCVDALLGTDMERVCRKAEEKAGVRVRPCYMYALTREGRRPPMVHVRQSLYSILEKKRKNPRAVNLLGYFAPLDGGTELFDLLRQAGLRQIRQISACENFDAFMDMAEANFNLVLNPEARPAAADLQERLDIPSIELTRLYQVDQIHKQYEALANVLGTDLDDSSSYEAAKEAMKRFRAAYPDTVFAIGEALNANPFELALALVRYGFKVAEIFASPAPEYYVYIRHLAALSPDTKILSNLDPSMLHYQAEGPAVTMTIGKDAGYYHPECPGVQWNQDIQPFGHDGVRRLFDALYRAAEEGSRDSFESTIVLGTGAAVPKKESSALLEAPACKGLRRHLTPFAPDQSGAVSVLYEMGGIIVICDAGGCAGNICGFDEPRWFGEKSAVFSAGLRDMDAILGRDEKLVEKLKKAADQVPASFAAIIGTPVPAVIGTDFRALERMSEKATGLTILSIDTDGMHWYDRGAEKAFEALFKTFCRDRNEDPEQYKDSKQNDHQIQNDPSALYAGTPKIGVLGATPLDLNDTKAADRLRRKILEETGKTAVCYGMGASLEDVRRAAGVSENLVVSPAGLSTAVWMEKKFGIPYRADLPLAEEYLPEEDLSGKKILVVHQQVMADSLRRRLEAKGAAHVDCATWFMLKKELGRQEDIRLKEEEDFTDLVREGGYDLILADQALRPLVPDYQGAWIHVPHFAVSGS